MKRVAILDNTVLANLIDAGLGDLLDKSHILFENFYVPEKIMEEFLGVVEPYLSVRQRFADGISFDRGFFRRCNTFDPIVLGVLQTESGVDPGEAEAIAQAVRRNITLLLTDDIDCQTYVRQHRPYIQCRSTTFLVALLDVNEFLPQPNQTWKKLYDHHKFKSSHLREAYNAAFKFIGTAPNRKFLSQKCSLKRILEA